MGAYRNAMELLVEEEVERHIRALPLRAASFINRLELIAYALNQLPSLYATSERGLDYQIQRGKAKFKEQITQAVYRALAAVRRDPIRTYVPLQVNHASAPMQDALYQLRLLLKNDKVDWENLPGVVEQALQTHHANGMTWDARYTFNPKPSTASNHKSSPSLCPLPSFAEDYTHCTDIPATQISQSPVSPASSNRSLAGTAEQIKQQQTPPAFPSRKPSTIGQSESEGMPSQTHEFAHESTHSCPDGGWDDPFFRL